MGEAGRKPAGCVICGAYGMATYRWVDQIAVVCRVHSLLKRSELRKVLDGQAAEAKREQERGRSR